MRGKCIFLKSEYFCLKKINKGISKASKQILSRGDMYWINICNFSSQKCFWPNWWCFYDLPRILWKNSVIFWKTPAIWYMLWICMSQFFSTQLYPKTNKNYEQLWKWKIQTPRVFWKRISIFLHLEKKAINLLVLHQLYSKGHAKLPGYSSSMAVYVGIQKKVVSDQMMRFFDHFRPFLSQKWPFSG